MHGLEPAKWESFALGQLGASAALLGLVFVGISVNLRDVLSSSRLVNRAAEAVLLLASIVVASTAVLLPDQTPRQTGIELSVVGILMLLAVALLQREPRRKDANPPVVESERPTRPPRWAQALRRLLGIGACVMVLAAAGSLLGDTGAGLYWWAGGVVLSYAGALNSAWVLIIEILR